MLVVDFSMSPNLAHSPLFARLLNIKAICDPAPIAAARSKANSGSTAPKPPHRAAPVDNFRRG